MADTKTPTPAEIAVMAGGALALIGSFLHYRYASSLWSKGFLPSGTLMALFATAMAVVVALRFLNVSLPARVVGLSWIQVHLVLGFFAALYAIAFLITAGGGRKVGTWLVTIGCIAAFVGAIMMSRDSSSTSAGPGPAA